MRPLRLGDAGEQVNPELEQLLLARFDDPEVAKVYADWLEERGEPRGRLMRLQLEKDRVREAGGRPPEVHHSGCLVDLWQRWPSNDDEDLIAKQWASWFPGLSPHDASLVWKHGFVRWMQLKGRRLAPAGLRPLLGRSSLRFLFSLSVEPGGFAGTMDGVELPPALRRLDWAVERPGVLAPLAGRTLASLNTWTLGLRAPLGREDLAALSSVCAPRLSRLDVELPPAPARQLVEHLAQMPWLTEVERIELTFQTADSLPRLLALSPTLSRLGRRLTLRLPQGELLPVRDRLRAQAPGVHLTPMPFVHPGSSKAYLDGSPHWHAASGRARADVPAVPMAEAHPHDFALCASCAGSDTWCVSNDVDRFTSGFDSTTYTAFTYRCAECGDLTSYRTVFEL